MEAHASTSLRRIADRYVLEELLAEGGMLYVWRALDEVLARAVAVKILRPHLARDGGFARRFRSEAVSAARLAHPAIVGVFDAGTENGTYFFVTEHVAGRTMRATLDVEGRLDPSHGAGLMLDVATALAHAHRQEVVHRGLRPENILLGEDGRVRVADFGIAAAAYEDGDLTRAASVLGGLGYASPEQLQGQETGPPADVYAAGVILYELLTGRPPFPAEGSAPQSPHRDPLPPGALVPALPKGLGETVLRAIAPDPRQRPSAEALRGALEPFGESTGRTRRLVAAPAVEIDGPQPSAGSVFRSWMLVPLLVVAVAAVMIAGGIALGRLTVGGPLGIRPAPQKPGEAVAQSAGRFKRLPVSSVEDVDFFGDGSENPEDAPLAVDGDPATFWRTEHYTSSDFGNLKDGLGLWLDLGATVDVRRMRIVPAIPGWSFELRAGVSPATAVAVADSEGRTTFRAASGTIVVEVTGVRAAGLLLWVTSLGSHDGQYAAGVSEIVVEGPR